MKRLKYTRILILSLLVLQGFTACDAGVTLPHSGSGSAKQVAAPVYPGKISFEDFEQKNKRRESNPVREEAVKAINRFTYGTSARVLKGIADNGSYSPLSLYYALALAATGAGGKTGEELLSLLGFGDAAELSGQCGNLYRLLYTDNEFSKLKIANSLWLDNEIAGQKVSFHDKFLKNARENFYSSVFTVDFSDPGVGKAMGKWVSDNTNGKLTPEFETNPEQLMSILNTVYYHDEWVDRFDAAETKEDNFYLENGTSVRCDFMHMNYGSHSFSKGEGFTRSALQLKNNGSMVFILPDENISVDSLISSAEQLEQIFTGGEDKNGKVVWSIPKFTNRSTLALKDILRDAGLEAAFSAQDADFSGIMDSKAYISAINQNTHIAIDENGVEASAFTEIQYMGAAMPVDNAEMILNRPFIYGITATDGTLLFVGVCRDAAH